MLRSELTAALEARRDNDVVVDVGGFLVPLTGVRYHVTADMIVLNLDPDELPTVVVDDGADAADAT